MEEKNQPDAQEKHEGIKKRLRIGGFVCLGIGVVFALIGFIDFFSSFGGFDMPHLFWCLFIGIPLCGIGGSLIGFSYKREVASYIKNETMPIVNEVSEEVKPAIKNVVSAVKEGLKGDEKKAVKTCQKCGKENDPSAKFCVNCGNNFQKVCTKCGKENSSDSKYCSICGSKL